MNIKYIFGSALALAIVASTSMASAPMPGGGGGGGAPALAMTDPFESPAIGGDQVILSPQLAELPLGGLIIKPEGDGMKKPIILKLAEGSARLGKTPEGDGGMKKPIPPSYPVGWQKVALGDDIGFIVADKPGLVTDRPGWLTIPSVQTRI